MTLDALPVPPKESMIYEDEWLYVCLASYPITKGHMAVVWKQDREDIHDLSDDEYDYLMEIVDVARDAMLKTFEVQKVYLIYMDEIKHVHWHLVPRYDQQGFNVLMHEPTQTSDFSLAPALKEAFVARLAARKIRLPGDATL